MLSLSDNNQADIIEAFNSTSRYLDDLLNIDNPHFKQKVRQIYPTELQFNKANSSDTEAPFLDLSVPCSLVVTCWERADLLAVVSDVFCNFLKSVLVHIRIKGEVGAIKLV